MGSKALELVQNYFCNKYACKSDNLCAVTCSCLVIHVFVMCKFKHIYYYTHNEHYYNSLVLGMFERVGMIYLK